MFSGALAGWDLKAVVSYSGTVEPSELQINLTFSFTTAALKRNSQERRLFYSDDNSEEDPNQFAIILKVRLSLVLQACPNPADCDEIMTGEKAERGMSVKETFLERRN